MLNRRSFLIHTSLVAGGLAVSPAALFAEGTSYESRRPPVAQRRFVSPAIEAEIARVKAAIADPELAWLFENCFPNTLDTTIIHHGALKGKPDTFVITGDIDAMWLRDSSAQIYPYVPYVNEDPALKKLVQGVINRHARSVLIDPYANAFNYDNTKRSEWYGDMTDMKMELHERKWEVDSLCYVIRLASRYYEVTSDTSLFDKEWVAAMKLIVKTFREQQRKTTRGPYHFQRGILANKDTLTHDGYGEPVKPVGLICSMFRPSDDATTYPFLIPSNFFAVISLRQLSKMATVIHEKVLAKESSALADEVEKALKQYGLHQHSEYGGIYAYETDALGHQLVIDEPNLPNLLSLPYFGAVGRADETWQRTRQFILSESNPYFVTGKYATGVGSDHTPKGYVWHLSLIAQALTSADDAEIASCLKMIKATHAGTGFMHEGFNTNNPEQFTRKWFAWANTLLGELIIKVQKERSHLLRNN